MITEKIHSNDHLPKVDQAVSDQQFLIDEIVLHIFSYLDYLSLSKAAQVCRQWNRVSKDKYLEITIPFRVLIKRKPTKHEILMDSRFVYTFTPKGVIWGGKDGVIHFWDKATSEESRIEKAHDQRISFLQCRKDKLLTATRKSIKIWEVRKDGLTSFAEIELKTPMVFAKIVFTGNHVFTFCKSSTAAFSETFDGWLLEDKKLHASEAFKLTFTLENRFKSLSFVGDEYVVATTRHLYLYDQRLKLSDHIEIKTLVSGFNNWAFHNGLIFVYSANTQVFQSQEKQLTVFQLDTNRSHLCTHYLPQGVNPFAFLTTHGKYIRLESGHDHLFFEYSNNRLNQIAGATTAGNRHSFMVEDGIIFLIEPHQIKIAVPSNSQTESSRFKKWGSLDLKDYYIPSETKEDDLLAKDINDDVEAGELVVSNERDYYSGFNIRFSEGSLYCIQATHRFSLDILDFKHGQNPLKRAAEKQDQKKRPRKFYGISSSGSK